MIYKWKMILMEKRFVSFFLSVSLVVGVVFAVAQINPPVPPSFTNSNDANQVPLVDAHSGKSIVYYTKYLNARLFKLIGPINESHSDNLQPSFTPSVLSLDFSGSTNPVDNKWSVSVKVTGVDGNVVGVARVILKKGGVLVGESTTTASGVALFSGLEEGVYEVEAISGSDSGKGSIELKAGTSVPTLKKKIAFNDADSTVLDSGERLCLYYVSDLNKLRVKEKMTTSYASVTSHKAYFIDYAGGTQELIPSGDKTFFYVSDSGGCVAGSGESLGLVAHCDISVYGDLWGVDESGFKVSCANNSQVYDFVSKRNSVEFRNNPNIAINYDARTQVFLPDQTNCAYTIDFEADKTWDNELFVYSFNSCD